MRIGRLQHTRSILRPRSSSLRHLSKIAVILTATLVLVSPAVLAQEDETRSMGFFFGGIGSCQHGYGFLHTGGGGQARLAGGLGITAEMGYLAYLEAPGRGVGLFSPGVVYSFNRSARTVPFVTGGYTLFFRSGTASGFFVGGGVDRWMGEHWGIRIEGRDQVMPTCNEHFLEARFAIIIR